MYYSHSSFSVLKQKTNKKSEVILRNELFYNFSVLKQKTNKKSEVILRNELFPISFLSIKTENTRRV